MIAIARGLRARKQINWASGRLRAIAVVAGAASAAGAIALPASASAGTTLFASGSSAAQPYMLALFAKYHKLHPSIRFSYNPDGGNAGVADVQSGRSQFAVQTAAPVASNTGTHFYKLFLDAVCIDVNSSNSVSALTIPQIRNIFLGIDTNWSQVGGSSNPIDPFGRPTSAGLYTIFKSSVLGGRAQASNVAIDQTDGLVANSIAHDSNGIGYVGLSHSTTSGQKPVSISGYSCNRANVGSENYPLTHWDWAVLPSSHPNVQAEQFVKWVETSAAAGKVANQAGAVWKKL